MKTLLLITLLLTVNQNQIALSRTTDQNITALVNAVKAAINSNSGLIRASSSLGVSRCDDGWTFLMITETGYCYRVLLAIPNKFIVCFLEFSEKWSDTNSCKIDL